MRKTRSLRSASGILEILLGGNFGFDLKNRKLFAGFGNQNIELMLNTDTNWIKPVLLNGWEKYDETIAYRIDSSGTLHIKGTARYGALNHPIFQLPATIKIPRNISLVVLLRDGYGRLDINTSGYVIPRGNEEQAYDEETGEPTGSIIEVGYLSLECGVML